MKIFTWMHRKLHNNADYSKISREKGTFAGNSRSRALHVHEKEAEAFQHDRDNESLFNVLGDSILAIGTFGVDQFKSSETLDGYFTEEEEYSVGDGEEEEDGELNPVAVKADLESEPLLSFQHDNPLRQFLELAEFGNDDAEEKKRKKRKTLADLFNEESAAVAAEKSTATKEVSAGTVQKWKSVQRATKNVRSLPKKLMPWKNEEYSSPTAKLHRLIRKMLKSRIHPELESKANGDQVGYSNAALKIGVAPGGPGLEYDSSLETAGNESFYLLQGVVS